MESLDIIFISNSESNAENNWHSLVKRFPRAKRVHGVKGILEAHRQAALVAHSEFFFVVDGDNQVKKSFNFGPVEVDLDQQSVYVYRCHNPINDLVYGYGAIKIYNKSLFPFSRPDKYIDLATSLAPNYVPLATVASETHFYMSPEEAWRGAFRECAKLAAQTRQGQKSQETLKRLQTWTRVAFKGFRNWEWVLKGANQGAEYGKSSKNDLSLINDFDWLHQKFIAL